MSVQALLHTALAGALADHAPLAEAVTHVFDATPVRAARPYAQVEPPVLSDWGTKDMAGREARIAVLLFDHGERPDRLRLLQGEAEAAIEAMPRDLGEGWQLLPPRLARSRIYREGGDGWAAMSEFVARMLRFQ